MAVRIFFGLVAWLAALAEAWLYHVFTGRIDPWEYEEQVNQIVAAKKLLGT